MFLVVGFVFLLLLFFFFCSLEAGIERCFPTHDHSTLEQEVAKADDSSRSTAHAYENGINIQDEQDPAVTIIAKL
jgi:hypothetical protein